MNADARTPVRLVYGPGVWEDYDLLDADSVRREIELVRCRTWGEFVRWRGDTWESFLDDWPDFAESDPPLAPEDPIDCRELLGQDSHLVAGSDPREAAYFLLPKPFDYILDDPILKEEIVISGGSPAGHLCSVSAKSPEAFERLGRVLKQRGHDNLEIVEDEDLVDEWQTALRWK